MSQTPLVWIVDDSRLQASLIERALGPEVEVELFVDGISVIERLGTAARFPSLTG
jgi:hypothetical protein